MPVWMKWIVALLIGVGIAALGFKYSVVVLNTFFILNCLVLIIVVLLQSGKAADLAGAFGGAGSQTAFGPRGAANILSKATTWCAIMFMLCAFALVLRVDKSAAQGSSVLQNISKPAPAKTLVPAPVVPAPQSSVPQSSAPATPQPAASQPATSQPKK